MDVRSPTHDLVRAHAYLRLRRKAAAGDPKSLLTPAGILGLIGRGGGFRGADGITQESAQERVRGRGQGAGEGAGAKGPAPDLGQTRAPPGDAAEITEAPPAAEPALAPLRQPGKAPAPAAAPKDPFVYDETWNEEEKLAGWHAGMAEADSLFAAAPWRASAGPRLASRRANPAPGPARAAPGRPPSARPRPHQNPSCEFLPWPPPPAADGAAPDSPRSPPAGARDRRSRRPRGPRPARPADLARACWRANARDAGRPRICRPLPSCCSRRPSSASR